MKTIIVTMFALASMTIACTESPDLGPNRCFEDSHCPETTSCIDGFCVRDETPTVEDTSEPDVSDIGDTTDTSEPTEPDLIETDSDSIETFEDTDTVADTIEDTDDPEADWDYDNLTNAEEEALGTSPYLSDTDGDGFSDWEEVMTDSDPLDHLDNADARGDVVFIAPRGGQTTPVGHDTVEYADRTKAELYFMFEADQSGDAWLTWLDSPCLEADCGVAERHIDHWIDQLTCRQMNVHYLSGEDEVRGYVKGNTTGARAFVSNTANVLSLEVRPISGEFSAGEMLTFYHDRDLNTPTGTTAILNGDLTVGPNCLEDVSVGWGYYTGHVNTFRHVQKPQSGVRVDVPTAVSDWFGEPAFTYGLQCAMNKGRCCFNGTCPNNCATSGQGCAGFDPEATRLIVPIHDNDFVCVGSPCSIHDKEPTATQILASGVKVAGYYDGPMQDWSDLYRLAELADSAWVPIATTLESDFRALVMPSLKPQITVEFAMTTQQLYCGAGWRPVLDPGCDLTGSLMREGSTACWTVQLPESVSCAPSDEPLVNIWEVDVYRAGVAVKTFKVYAIVP